ncbi:hypothetical protein BpHYR1_049533 [Brachionus plicatilis]|uniref:Uncharacterized protein n=1 Tax=Brachionus plicatilis TaxID=10195 RepID=A0A3M7QPS9_BRAPC|nr:hypothetical protein BpHYR1_049533 [Brachionus plicatilis]
MVSFSGRGRKIVFVRRRSVITALTYYCPQCHQLPHPTALLNRHLFVLPESRTISPKPLDQKPLAPMVLPQAQSLHQLLPLFAHSFCSPLHLWLHILVEKAPDLHPGILNRSPAFRHSSSLALHLA